MNYFERRKLKKAVHHLLHTAAHARHMRGDIADPEDLRRLIESEDALSAAWKARDAAACDRIAETLNAAIDKVYPPRPDSGWRENVEVFAVALAIAMAFRTYFLQPFKIPTNSMWPTLYGITVDPTAKRDLLDTFPLNLVRICVFGERYIEITAKASGEPSFPMSRGDSLIVSIGGVEHEMPNDTKCWTFQPGSRPYIEKGTIIAAGRQRYGDHIFVDRISYNLHRPRRNDVFVFSTVDLKYSDVHTNDFYIKRLIGLPGDSIKLRGTGEHVISGRQSIDMQDMVINGEPLKDVHARVLEDSPVPGTLVFHPGYTVPKAWDGALSPQNQPLQLSPTQYLPCGDNTEHSLDGRYFGPVEQKRVVGPACFVYWPFGSRWGVIR